MPGADVRIPEVSTSESLGYAYVCVSAPEASHLLEAGAYKKAV